MSKNFRKALRLEFQRRKQACFFVSRQCVFVGQDHSSNPQILVSTKTLKCGFGTNKVQNRDVFCSACLVKPKVWISRFGRFRKDACPGKSKVHAEKSSTSLGRLCLRGSHKEKWNKFWIGKSKQAEKSS